MPNNPPKQNNAKVLAALCTRDKLTRCDYFSDTYSVVLNVSGEKKLSDITHISLPFKPNREKAVMEYFDIDREGMQELYKTLAACISNNARTTTYLIRERNTQSIVSYYRVETINKVVHGSDIYIVTEHLRPLIQTYFNGETTVKQIVNFGARLAKMVADIHQSEEESVTLRVPDAEQIFVADDGKYVFGCFQYAFNAISSKEPIVPAVTAPLHINPHVSRGEAGDEGTDMYSIASMLWSLLNGDGFDKTTPTGVPPKYAPDAIVPILEMGFQADPEMFMEFKKRLLKLDKELSKPENNGAMKVPVPIADRPIESPTVLLDIGIESEVSVPREPEYDEAGYAGFTETKEPVVEDPAAEEPVAEEPAPETAIEDTQPTEVHEEPAIYEQIEPAEVIEPEYDEPEADVYAPAEEPDSIEGEIVDETVGEDEPKPEKKPLIRKPIIKLPKPMKKPKQEDIVDISEDDVIQDTVKVLDTSEYLEEHEAETDIVMSTMEELMNISITYHKPRFFWDQLFIACAIGAILAVMLYVSVSQHLISLW